jgi:hypothetical protein
MQELQMRWLSRSRGRPAGAGRLIAAAEPTVTSWTVRAEVVEELDLSDHVPSVITLDP